MLARENRELGVRTDEDTLAAPRAIAKNCSPTQTNHKGRDFFPWSWELIFLP